MKLVLFGGVMITIVNLLDEPQYLNQYILLRNSNNKKLLTACVNVDDTLVWLKDERQKVFLACENEVLLGVCIIYFSKENEVSIFVKEYKKGIGTQLLAYVKEVAESTNIKSLWAWIEDGNIASYKLFNKNGFNYKKDKKKFFNGQEYFGKIYEVKLK